MQDVHTQHDLSLARGAVEDALRHGVDVTEAILAAALKHDVSLDALASEVERCTCERVRAPLMAECVTRTALDEFEVMYLGKIYRVRGRNVSVRAGRIGTRWVWKAVDPHKTTGKIIRKLVQVFESQTQGKPFGQDYDRTDGQDIPSSVR